MSDPSKAIRSAIVGCGVIGTHHAVVLSRHEAFEVTAVVDIDRQAAESAADSVEAETGRRPSVHVDLGDLTAEHTDLAAVCTPSGMHVDHTEQLLGAGLHVVTEKPLDVSVARGRELLPRVEAAAARGQVCSVISQHRFDPASVVVRSALDKGRLGRLTSAVVTTSWFRSQSYYDSGDWRGTWEMDGGGAAMNQGVHMFDLLTWFLGRPVEVSAFTGLLAHERVEIEDVAVATIRFESGALATIHSTTAAYPGLTTRVQVMGDRGSAIIEKNELTYFHVGASDGGDDVLSADGKKNQADAALADEFGAVPEQLKGREAFVMGHARQYDDIARAINDAGAPAMGVADALQTLALVRAVYVSATLGDSVLFDDVLNGSYDAVEPTVAGVI